MQHHVIALVGNGAEDFPLQGRGIVQHGERLVAVAGDEHAVEAFHALPGAADFNMRRPPPDAGHRGVEADLMTKRGG